MTEFNSKAADLICRKLALGNSLAKICREHNIPYHHVFEWLNENEEFAKNYARAREAQADFHADSIIEISDTEKDAAKARNRIDARKWVAGKMKPKKYGDKMTLAGDAEAPLFPVFKPVIHNASDDSNTPGTEV